MANDPRGPVYDIEIQVSREPRIGRRMRYYQSAMDVSELGRGDGVADLPESYIAFFLPARSLRLGASVLHGGARLRGGPRAGRGKRVPLARAERAGLGGRCGRPARRGARIRGEGQGDGASHGQDRRARRGVQRR